MLCCYCNITCSIKNVKSVCTKTISLQLKLEMNIFEDHLRKSQLSDRESHLKITVGNNTKNPLQYVFQICLASTYAA